MGAVTANRLPESPGHARRGVCHKLLHRGMLRDDPPAVVVERSAESYATRREKQKHAR